MCQKHCCSANNHQCVIIDDEADYATPNSKINKQEKSRINELTGNLIGKTGVYIGVTATPARLDLNKTHENQFSNLNMQNTLHEINNIPLSALYHYSEI